MHCASGRQAAQGYGGMHPVPSADLTSGRRARLAPLVECDLEGDREDVGLEEIQNDEERDEDRAARREGQVAAHERDTDIDGQREEVEEALADDVHGGLLSLSSSIPEKFTSKITIHGGRRK